MDKEISNINIAMIVANIIIAGVNAILTYYSIRRSSKIAEYSQFVEITKKSDIWVKISAVGCNEIIEVVNKGQNPMKKIESEISLSAKKGNEAIELGKVRFIRDDILRPTESFQIPVYERLRKMLLNSKLIKLREEEVPSGEKDPLSGEEIFTKIDVKQLLTEFDLSLQVELKYKVFKEEIKINKQFGLQYRFEPDFFEDPTSYQFADNYDIKVYEISGKWSDSFEKEEKT